MVIGEFIGENRFLSNFYPSVVYLDGVRYESVEHAFQAAKTVDEDDRTFVRLAGTPGEAKKRGNAIVLRPDWESIKLSVMEDLLRQKFNQDSFRIRLVATGNHELVEGNWWKDTFWGVCDGVGQNHLGKLLMKIRQEFIAGLDHAGRVITLKT